jgi:poly(A) polymerase
LNSSPPRNGHEPQPGPRLVPRAEHGLGRESFPPQALEILERLEQRGHAAYVVGGSLRDLLLGRHPKDFDIATDAHPEQVRRIFRNSRLIGRRFRLVHVYFGRHYVEVATFRTTPSGHEEGSAVSDEGRLLRDNVYGSERDDAYRRDFTVNALYYDARNEVLRDWVGGLPDLRRSSLRLIGEPAQRYREDPVRMLRAVRFEAKLGFTIDPETAAPMAELGPLLRTVPPARLFEEMNKLFLNGHARAALAGLRRHGLLAVLFPWTEDVIRDERGGGEALAFLERSLADTDARVAQDLPVTPTFLVATLLWPPTRRLARAFHEGDGLSWHEAHVRAAELLLHRQRRLVEVPRRFTEPALDVLGDQALFDAEPGGESERYLRRARFAASLDLLRNRIGYDAEASRHALWHAAWERSGGSHHAVGRRLPRFADPEPEERGPAPGGPAGG